MSNRWDAYVPGRDGAAFYSILSAARVERPGNVLFALGTGFDPRCLQALSAVTDTVPAKDLRVAHIQLPGASESADPAIVAMAEHHVVDFGAATAGIDVKSIDYPVVYDNMTAGPRIGAEIVGLVEVVGPTVVVVDISSLPTTIYFPVLRALLTALDGGTHSFELIAVACENPAMDALILGQGVEDAELVGGFRSGVADSDPFAVNPIVWVPVMGEGAHEELERIHNRLAPKETVPVLPFPSKDPRRSDKILLQHWPILIDRFRATPYDIVTADERTPFDVYRTISSIAESYRTTLSVPLGEISVVVSAHASKTLALGVFLAAYDHQLGVASAPRSDYAVESPEELRKLTPSSRLVTAWLAGAPYAP